VSSPLSTMREHDLRPRGLSMRVCAWGPAAGPAVVCCHGWLDQGAAWDAVAVQLVARGYRVFAPDHRGHGHSDWTPTGSTYHFMEYVADLDALLDVLELPSAVLVGHSMGGTISSLLAGLRPQRVTGLVLLDGLGPPRVSDDDASDQAVAFLDQNRAPRPQRPMDSLDRAAERIRRTNPHLSAQGARALAHRVTRATPDGLIWRWDPLHRTRAAVAYDADRHLSVLRRIRCPVAVGVGADGWYAHMSDLEQRILAIPRVVAHDAFSCGHDLHHAVPSAVADRVDAVSGAGTLPS